MPNATWVVYTIPMKGSPEGARAVCDEREWAAMDAARPGFFTLVQGGITNEGEAERLARGRAGEARPRNAKAVPLAWPDQAAAVLAESTANTAAAG
jgi:hypothetical protein